MKKNYENKEILNNLKGRVKKMKNKESNKNERKNKKKLLFVLGISVLTILGGTLAYFTTSDTIKNIFNTSKYETQIVENFESPDNWTPGTTTRKNIVVTNKGTIDMAVRASYTEKWESANERELPLKDENNNVVSIINFNNGWEKNEDGFYYYGSKDNLTKLTPNETSTSFISGVTFNENISASLKRTESEDGKTITYESTGNGYDNAKYTLTIKIDTIQYDQAHNIW